MAIVVTSNTDSTEALHTKEADSKDESVKEESASTEEESQKDETVEESETSEKSNDEGTEAESEEEEDSQEETEDQEEEKKERADLPKGVKKRIGRLTRQRQEAKQEAEYWKREALKRQEQSAPKEEEQSTKASEVESDEPREEDFDDHKDYLRAYVKWEFRQEKLMDEQKSKEAQIKSEHQNKEKDFKSKMSEYSKQNEDFKEAFDELVDENYYFSPGLTECLFTTDASLEVLHELMKDRKELDRINSLSPIAAAKEFGKVEAKIAKSNDSSSPKEIKTTKAPPPPTRVSGKSEKATKRSIYDPSLSFQEYERLRLEEIRRSNSF